MDNKEYLKKTLIKTIILFVLFLITLLIVNKMFYQKYTDNYNNKIAEIIYKIKEKYPNVSNKEIGEILNSKENKINLKDYGITNESVIIENDNLNKESLVVNVSLSLVFFILLVSLYLKYSKYKDSKVKEINDMIEEVSMGNYKVDFENKSEDELSIFRDNLFKITLKLKEESENSLKDKKELKENLENISHQLKTPLTAMSISIDNILDNNNLKEDKKREFLLDIKKEINNINFLIKELLNLSRFDANVVVFERKENDVLKIVKEAEKRVDLIRDLKNIEIVTKGKSEKLFCDFNWEVEALSNIIKNALEHSLNDSKINIDIERNSAFLSIKVTNYGTTIDKKDIENIFKRFYNGKNSIKDSVGIGLSLTKSIIEKDNGKITVESKDNKTTFEIKYFNFN